MSENAFFKSIPGILINEKLRPNKRLVIFFIFIGIATFIWFLWTLEKEYTTIISNPIEFVDIPNDQVLVNKLPEKVQMEVRGRGFAILKHNWDITKGRLKVNFETLNKGNPIVESGQSLTLSLNSVKGSLANQLDNIQINTINPENVTFTFAQMTRKKVPVKPDLDLEIEKQYMIRGEITVLPDSIEIIGPSSILDTIQAVSTAQLKLRKVDSNIQRNLALVELHDKVSFSKKRVQVGIPIEQFTEKSLEAPVKGINVPDSLMLKVFPASAILTFRVVVSEFENIQADNFNLFVDYKQIKDGTASKLAITVTQYPDYIENIRVNPETVAYILENK